MKFGLSKRRACALVRLARSTEHYKSKRAPDTVLAAEIKQIAGDRPRFGYRRICQVIRKKGVKVNHKRIYRIYRSLNLAVRKRGRRKYSWGRKTPKCEARGLNERWSMDFTSDSTAKGNKFRTLNIIDDFSRECMAIKVATHLPSERVIDVRNRLRWTTSDYFLLHSSIYCSQFIMIIGYVTIRQTFKEVQSRLGPRVIFLALFSNSQASSSRFIRRNRTA